MSIENDEITKLKVALEESKTRERIAIQELQKMRQRAEKAEKNTIHKACEWLWNEIYERVYDMQVREILMNDNYRANLVSSFREAMEE